MKFSILVPDATVNYIKNPSARYDTTDWNAAGATLARSLDYARFGITSLKVVTAGTALREGAYYRVNALTTLAGIGSPITVSAYLLGSGTVRIRVIDSPAGSEWASQSVQLRSDRWTRVSVTGMIKGSNDVRLYVETNEGSAKARTFYIDGAQMELKPYPTTFCDGEQDGCTWDGVYHASISRRPASTRSGGRWVVLAGEEREVEDLYMTVVGGLGMAPIKNNIQDYALAPGSYFQNSKVEARIIALTFHAKHMDILNRSRALSLRALHQLRQMLIDVVKPDRTFGNEPIWFEYDDGVNPIRFQARYDGGLEGDWDIRNKWTNSFPLRLLAVDPFVYDDNQVVQAIDFQETVTVNYVAGRINGQWNRMNYGMDNSIRNFAFGPRGELYAIAGTYLKINNNAAAIDPMVTANGISYWDGEKWNRLGSGMNSVSTPTGAVAVAPNGYVYVTGNFTSIGGVAANYVAYWNGTSWNAMGTGFNAAGYAIAVAPNGDVYAGGNFTTAGGVACYYIARWDGFQWRRVGQFGGLSSYVNDLVISKDGTLLYCGGNFTTQQGGSTTLNYIAKYTISTGLFSALGNGFSAVVHALQLSDSGILYAGGEFPTSNDGLTTFNKIAMWNGGVWLPMSTGVTIGTNPHVYSLALTPDGRLYAGGGFFVAGTINCFHLTLWNGYVWTNADIAITSASTNVFSMIVDPITETLFLGMTNQSGGLSCSGITTVNNPGSAEVRPIVYLKGPGSLRWLENQTTGATLYLDMTLQNAEEVFIDFGKGTITSTQRGSLLYTLLPGSDFRAFTLLPGENRIAAFMVNDVDAQMTMQFRPAYWSVDAVQNTESL